MFKPKPKQFKNEEAFKNVAEASVKQTGGVKRPKTVDEVKYPFFEVPVNSKVLVYIPNHRQVIDGEAVIRADRGAFHNVRSKSMFGTVRCSSGLIAEEDGFDGSCPFCQAVSECWDLFGIEKKEIALSKGIPVDQESEELRSIGRSLMEKMAVTKADRKITFPIVVIEGVEGKPTTPKLDEKGNLCYKVMWYQLREATFMEKWLKPLEDEDDTCPAGRWAILNYTYESKDGKHNKMMSAQKLVVSYKNMSADYKAWAEEFDRLTEEWTPKLASETVIANFYLDNKDGAEYCDEIMADTREKLTLYKSLSPTGAVAPNPPQNSVGATQSAQAVLNNFGSKPMGVEPAELPQAQAEGMPPEVPVQQA